MGYLNIKSAARAGDLTDKGKKPYEKSAKMATKTKTKKTALTTDDTTFDWPYYKSDKSAPKSTSWPSIVPILVPELICTEGEIGKTEDGKTDTEVRSLEGWLKGFAPKRRLSVKRELYRQAYLYAANVLITRKDTVMTETATNPFTFGLDSKYIRANKAKIYSEIWNNTMQALEYDEVGLQ